MKKLLIAILIALLPQMAMALDTLTSVQDLVDKTGGDGLSAIVFTEPTKDKSWATYKTAIEGYEKAHKEVKFFLAPVSNPEFAQFAMLLGVQQIPTTIFSEKGEILTGGAGTPKDTEALTKALDQIQAGVAKMKEMRKLEEQKKQEEIPAAPQKRQEDSTIDFRPHQGYAVKVMNA